MEQRIYKTAMYLRLSKGDGDVDGNIKSESNSITNQRMIIQSYIDRHDDLELVGTYIDDGYTGLNYEREQFRQMMADAEAGKIDCICTKDLSRLGRERIETGTYIRQTFKEKGIRYIAINDNYDTLTADGSETNIVMPVKALVNDNFSRDISNKVRSSQQIKRMNGEFIGAFAPYGYAKSKENRNRLVVDGYAADIVREIYAEKLSGMSANAIAEGLNRRGVLCPSEYKRDRGERYATSFKQAAHSRWSAVTVKRILENAVYTGVLEQGKRAKVSYKVKREIQVPEAEWIRVENTHEPIISRQDYEAVQILLQRDMRAVGKGAFPKGDKTKDGSRISERNGRGKSGIAESGEDGSGRGGYGSGQCSLESIVEEKCAYKYAGLLFCGDCGMSMVRRKSKYKEKEIINYICSGYNRNGDCSRHSIREEMLDEIVAGELNRYIHLLCDTQSILEKIGQMEDGFENAMEQDAEIVRLRQELTKCSALKSSLYQDLQEGLLTEEQFAQYREIYGRKEQEILSAISEQEKLIRKLYADGVAVGEKMAGFKERLLKLSESQKAVGGSYEKYNSESTEVQSGIFSEIDRLTLVTFIDRILIYEDDRIEIVFKYGKEIGTVADMAKTVLDRTGTENAMKDSSAVLDRVADTEVLEREVC